MRSSRGIWERCNKGTFGGGGFVEQLDRKVGGSVCLSGCAVLYPLKSAALIEELSLCYTFFF